MEDNWTPLTAGEFALVTFGGTVSSFIRRRKRVHCNGVLGQSRWAKQWGASDDDVKSEVLKQLSFHVDKTDSPEVQFLRKHFLH